MDESAHKYDEISVKPSVNECDSVSLAPHLKQVRSLTRILAVSVSTYFYFS